MNFILPIILLLSSIGLFFGYIDPNYKGNGAPIVDSTDYASQGILPLRVELIKYQDIANGARTIVAKQQNLIEKRNTISETNQARLERMLPSNIDNIRLIIEISKIAENRNLVARNISVGDIKNTGDAIGGSIAHGTLSLSFTVNASYINFLNLLSDLENNLRIVDITSISFNSTDSGLYDFTVNLNTYWLK